MCNFEYVGHIFSVFFYDNNRGNISIPLTPCLLDLLKGSKVLIFYSINLKLGSVRPRSSLTQYEMTENFY